MAIPGMHPRRTIDVVTQTVVSLSMIGGATYLGIERVFDVASILAGYALAGAVSGLPIIVKRDGTHQ